MHRCIPGHWDVELQHHWWRTANYLVLIGRAGDRFLNTDRFQFAQRTIYFSGFASPMLPLSHSPNIWTLSGISPTPTSTTDVRSWFALVNLVTNYGQLRDIIRPFKPFLSPKTPLRWSVDLESAFQASEAIRHGVEIFDLRRPDWLKLKIGYLLSQNHCDCATT